MNGWTFSQKSLRVRKKPLPPLKLDIHTDVLVAHDNKTQHSRRSKKITTQFSSDQLNPMIDWIFGRIWGIIQQNTTQYRCKRKKRITQLTANQPKNPRPHNDLKKKKNKKMQRVEGFKGGSLGHILTQAVPVDYDVQKLCNLFGSMAQGRKVYGSSVVCWQ